MAKTFAEFRADFSKKILGAPLSKKALNSIGRLIVKRIRETTAKGQTIASGRVERLPPLAESTKKQKRRKGQSTASRLRDTGSMMASLTFRSNLRKQTLTVEPRDSKNKEKAQFAHDGSSNRPERPFIPNDGLDNRTNAQMIKIVLADLRRQLAKL